MATKKATPEYIGKTTAPWTNLRKSPNGEILNVLPKGTEVKIISQGDDWCKVSGGFIMRNLLEITEVKNERLGKKDN